MTAVWASRQEELLSDCVVSPHVFEHMVDRLCDFVVPYQRCLETEAGKRNVHLYLVGLLSHLDRKNAEEIAGLVAVERLVMQQFVGTAPWDHRPLIKVLVGQVVHRLGEPDGVIAFGGREAAMVWSPGKDRQLSSRCVHGVRVSPRPCEGVSELWIPWQMSSPNS